VSRGRARLLRIRRGQPPAWATSSFDNPLTRHDEQDDDMMHDEVPPQPQHTELEAAWHALGGSPEAAALPEGHNPLFGRGMRRGRATQGRITQATRLHYSLRRCASRDGVRNAAPGELAARRKRATHLPKRPARGARSPADALGSRAGLSALGVASPGVRQSVRARASITVTFSGAFSCEARLHRSCALHASASSFLRALLCLPEAARCAPRSHRAPYVQAYAAVVFW
jgi:hypothetical protein